METAATIIDNRGIAIDLEKPDFFPAAYNWGQYEDFKSQLQDKVRQSYDPTIKNTKEHNEGVNITDGSTFKPKSLKNY